MKWVLVAFLFCGCSLFTKKGDWGKDALWPLKGKGIKEAFIRNAKSAHVWAPLAAAGAIHWGGYDQKITAWAVEESVIFKDQEAADNWSDIFDEILRYEMYITPLFTASTEEGGSKEWLVRKGKGYVVIAASQATSKYAHDRIAEAVHRRRPNSADHESFPSGHSAKAGTRNIITLHNLKAIPMDPDLRFGIETVNTTMAGAVLWGRIEGNRHYPSDVLVGYALGAFLSGFVYDSLMYGEGKHPEAIAFLPSKDRWTLMYTYSF